MYGRFIADVRDRNPDAFLAGLTATPYRLDSGRLDIGDDRLFDRIVYTYDIAAGIADGYLTPLISKRGIGEINTEGVPVRGGEFLESELQKRALNPETILAACKETAAYIRETHRRKTMIFCTGVAHAFAVAQCLDAMGVTCGVVHGAMSGGDRDRVILAFKEGRLQAIINVDVLTTGFNDKGVDLIVLMRATLSTGLYLQMIGRGTRVLIDLRWLLTKELRREAIAHSDKPNCLILDYGGNQRRHGPIDDLQGSSEHKSKPKGEDDSEAEPIEKVKATTVRARHCEECNSLMRLDAPSCPDCGWMPPIVADHKASAEDEHGITKAEQKPDWRDLTGWDFKKHIKQGKPPSLRIDYWAGLDSMQSEWLAMESDSQWARDKAGNLWLKFGGDTPAPATVDEALERTDELTMPARILVRKSDNGFKEIAAHIMPTSAPSGGQWAMELDDEIPF